MNLEQVSKIQEKLINALDSLSNAVGEELALEVAKSNAVSQLANTYIKSCNLIIRVEESKQKLSNKLEKASNEE